MLETAAVLLISAIIAAPLVAIVIKLIILPVEWRENVEAVWDTRKALNWVAMDARQAGCYTPGESDSDHGTFEWTDYTATEARKVKVRYYSEMMSPKGMRRLTREETVNDSPPRTLVVGSVEDFGIRQEGRLVHAWVAVPTLSGKGSDTLALEVAAMMRPSGPSVAHCGGSLHIQQSP